MSLTGTGTGSLFKRIYVGLRRINAILNHQGGGSLTAPSRSAGTFYTDWLAEFTSTSAQSDVLDGFVTDTLNPARGKSNEILAIQSRITNLIQRQANDDTPLKQYSVSYAIQELIRQMGVATTAYVPGAIVAPGTPAAGASNTGVCQAFGSVTGPYLQGASTGLYNSSGNTAMDLQYIYPETLTFKCTQDSYTGTAAKHSETFSFAGQQKIVSDPLLWNFTSVYGATAVNGSNAAGSVSVCDAAVYAGAGAGGNLLKNGDFLTYANVANVPDYWTLVTGTAGTHIADGGSGTGIKVGATHALTFLGDSSTLTCIKQTFGNNSVSGGTTSSLLPNTVYHGNFWIKTSSSSTGILQLSLVNGAAGTGTLVTDNNAVSNIAYKIYISYAGAIQTNSNAGIDLSTVGTSYSSVSFHFRTPAVLPSNGLCLRMQLSTTLNTGKTLSISDLSLRAPAQAYPGGPYVSLFNGSTGSVLGDTYSQAFTNDFGNLTNKVGFQQMFNWLFGMQSMQAPPPISPLNPPVGSIGFMQLPVVGTTNIEGTLAP